MIGEVTTNPSPRVAWPAIDGGGRRRKPEAESAGASAPTLPEPPAPVRFKGGGGHRRLSVEHRPRSVNGTSAQGPSASAAAAGCRRPPPAGRRWKQSYRLYCDQPAETLWRNDRRSRTRRTGGSAWTCARQGGATASRKRARRGAADGSSRHGSSCLSPPARAAAGRRDADPRGPRVRARPEARAEGIGKDRRQFSSKVTREAPPRARSQEAGQIGAEAREP